jgi:hypothetical protein
MGGHVWIVRCAFVLAVTVGAASGCSGAQGASGPSDAGTPASSTSSGPSVTPSATAAATLDDAAWARIPKAARAHTPQGAEAFARFYLEQFNRSWVEADPEIIRPYALTSCSTCSNFVGTATWLQENGLHYDGHPTTVGASGWLPETTTNRAFIQIVNNQEARHIVDADGSVHDSIERTPALDEVELRWNDDAWSVAAVRTASK